ncbi:hypothetical protein EUGRSUZ_C01611 [Eucalyptus grandis]|uniref:Uncharacterized protein n=2 Tax=Eucalyptus grandis TaxID=71139 RepID=A0ACC3LF48_EUCGR|nr:hypothetical protein EUGRSUZ_C01611 [Eucalyptus grandis]
MCSNFASISSSALNHALVPPTLNLNLQREREPALRSGGTSHGSWTKVKRLMDLGCWAEDEPIGPSFLDELESDDPN